MGVSHIERINSMNDERLNILVRLFDYVNDGKVTKFPITVFDELVAIDDTAGFEMVMDVKYPVLNRVCDIEIAHGVIRVQWKATFGILENEVFFIYKDDSYVRVKCFDRSDWGGIKEFLTQLKTAVTPVKELGG